MGQARNWTKEEEQYLVDNYGSISYYTLAKKLNRTVTAIDIKARKLELGAFLECGDYVTWNQFLNALGYTKKGNSYKEISWIRNRNFPIHTKRVRNNSFKIVYVHEFWKWAEQNKDLLDFAKCEENILGEEPGWVKEKRKLDYETNSKYKKTPWTNVEDERLRKMLSKYQYSYMDISKNLNRTCGAIQRRCCDLELKERPIKADNHIKWTESEEILLIELICKGFGYELIAEKINKSSKAIRGKIFRIYGTENLDKVRVVLLN